QDMRLNDITKAPAKAIKRLTELGTPGMMESLEKIKEIATTIQEIEDSLKAPPMLKNIENMNLTSEAMQNVAENIKNIRSELDATGIIEEARNTSTIVGMNSTFNKKTQNLKDLAADCKDIARSVKELTNELKLDTGKSAQS
ncbi:MAG TPA: hypothetical protein VK553_00770, partial [Candidatus Nitrosopolaris rasttigaisensis]|nr:hypothetical protein [Candidatus Nitrosopolaris rasttigaisensis]